MLCKKQSSILKVIMSERIKNRFDHEADLAITALKHRPPLHIQNKGLINTLHTLYPAAPLAPEQSSSQSTRRNATPSEIAAMLKRGEAATIPQQDRHRKEGGRGRPK